ncbi:hypothetical protein R75461_01182 [Paraburkholderia nemoris]|uniref:hypothetical protein n=1 Tax=Paraburkholderia nemoris TaxID=2793076 RepID=UPI001AFEFD70|nr:hypothetical protein [Paraburkholderia nemoris]CAE6713708.1 hypothetical protein R75461_01182 [Paraburkholderia nemoris]
MPHAMKAPTPEILLELMKPGQVYAPHNLARLIRWPSAEVKKMLLDMVACGTLRVTQPHKRVSFIMAGTEHMRKQAGPKPQIDPETVAQPRTYAVLTGLLSGYDAEIARRQQLCMTLRRVG